MKRRKHKRNCLFNYEQYKKYNEKQTTTEYTHTPAKQLVESNALCNICIILYLCIHHIYVTIFNLKSKSKHIWLNFEYSIQSIDDNNKFMIKCD